MRICKKCGSTDFRSNGACIPCGKKRSRDWYAKNKQLCISKAKEWKKRNPAKVKAGAKVYRDKTKEEMRRLQEAWVKANPEKVTDKSRRYYEKHREKCRERSRAYYENNPEKAKMLRDKYRSTIAYREVSVNNALRRRTRLGSGKLSKGLTEKLYASQKGKCVCCRLPLGDDFHLDHIVPLSRGGTNEDKNIQLLRAICNIKKHAKDPVEFMRERGFLC